MMKIYFFFIMSVKRYAGANLSTGSQADKCRPREKESKQGERTSEREKERERERERDRERERGIERDWL